MHPRLSSLRRPAGVTGIRDASRSHMDCAATATVIVLFGKRQILAESTPFDARHLGTKEHPMTAPDDDPGPF